jgi:hypothetical protein
MTANDILVLLHDSPLGVASREIKGLFAACETVHFLGLCLMIGAIMVFDLRMLGVLRRGSLKSALNYTNIAAFGLALMLTSGIVLFSSKPADYVANVSFRLKMLFLALAIINLGWFHLVEHRKVMALPDGALASAGAKRAAAVSLVLWICVIACGRWLPVTAFYGG